MTFATPAVLRRQRGRHTGAYSLLEILTVIAVIGLVAGLTTMATGLLTATSLTASTRNFADFLNLCRSQAISDHTAIRVGVVTQSSRNREAEYRAYAAWRWDKRSRDFVQLTRWKSIAPDLAFESEFPNHLRESLHAREDASSIRGDYVFSIPKGKNQFVAEDANGDQVRLAFVQFKPSGRVEAPGGDQRNLIFAMRYRATARKQRSENWSQINLDTLTGRYRVYRP